MPMPAFSAITQEPEDPIYGLQVVYKKDERPDKINLSIGVFPGKGGKAFRFQVVDRAEELLFSAKHAKDYLPIDGLALFNKGVKELIFSDALRQDRAIYTTQTIGSTGALHVAGKFLATLVTKKIYIPDPTWVNHKKLFEATGMQVGLYPYTMTENGNLNIQAVLTAIDEMEEGACLLLQASCHNPTGVDPDDAAWRSICQAAKKKKLICLFDIAYQGVGRNLEEDAQAIHHFFREGLELLVAVSFAKNMGLYAERVGALLIVSEKEKEAAIASQVRKIIRSIYSSPCLHGADVASLILSDTQLRDAWKQELAKLQHNLTQTRHALYNAFIKFGQTPPSSLLSSVGLFCMLDLSKEQVVHLREKHAIYLCDDGRVNLAAVKDEHIDRLVKAVSETKVEPIHAS
jgi:aspartate/tyrosine/aromatic aminotransferase